MEIKITYFVTLLLYAVVISQSFVFLLAISGVTRHMRAKFYKEARLLLDKHISGSISLVYYATLLSTISLVAFTVTNPNGLLFICSVVALVLLIADIFLTLRANIPFQQRIRDWSPTRTPENWGSYRSRWITGTYVKQALNLAGFVALVCGFVFGL